MATNVQKNYTAAEDFPDLSQHNNWMAKCLTPAIYEKLRDKKTVSGYTLDSCIQTGVDNPGKRRGLLLALTLPMLRLLLSKTQGSEDL